MKKTFVQISERRIGSQDHLEVWVVDEAGLAELRKLGFNENEEVIEIAEELERVTNMVDRVWLRYPKFIPLSAGRSQLNLGSYFRNSYPFTERERES